MRILSVGIVRASDDSCNNALYHRFGVSFRDALLRAQPTTLDVLSGYGASGMPLHDRTTD